MSTIEKIREIIIPICKKYGVEKAFLFGSYARGEARENSDVDIRVIRTNEIEGFIFTEEEKAILYKVANGKMSINKAKNIFLHESNKSCSSMTYDKNMLY